jgi:hypothetical protein
MVNDAIGYNDLITGGSIQLYDDGPSFTNSGVVTPVFNDKDNLNESKGFCEQGRRCHYSKRMAISEEPDDVVIVPGGGAHAHYYAFEIYCKSSEKCRGFSNYVQALNTLANKPIHARISLSFHSDGRRSITCDTDRINKVYILSTGWQTLDCHDSSVNGGGWF